MKKKCFDFQMYKRFQKMSFNDVNRFLMTYYATAFEDGQNSTTLADECVAALTEDHLMEILLSVKGIGVNRAKLVVSKILEEGVSYTGSVE